MKKKQIIVDSNIATDNASLKSTRIVLKNTATGKTIFEGHNKVITSGSEFNAIKDFHFNYDANTNTPTFEINKLTGVGMNEDFLNSVVSYDKAFVDYNHPFDDVSGINPINWTELTQTLPSFEYIDKLDGTPTLRQRIYEYFMRRTYLFCVGIDGCGIENSRVYKVRNTKWIAPYGYAKYDTGVGLIDENIKNCLIPFKWVSASAQTGADAAVDKTKYFGRSKFNDSTAMSNYIGYYFKGFDASPRLIRRYEDDSTSLSNIDDVWNNDRLSAAEICVQLKMSISQSDCRDYFKATVGNTASAKINTISLCTAVPYSNDTVNQSVVYRDIRPFTKFNFPNESLIEDSKEIEISYYLYY